MIVVHSFPTWLPQTMVWLYTQARHLPQGIESHIVCEKTENLAQFGLPHIHPLSEQPRWRQIYDRGLRKLRVRRHLGFQTLQAKRYQAQVLHSHFGNIGWCDIGVARQAKLKHIVTFYGMDVNYLPMQDPHWRQRYRTLFKHVDHVLCEGAHMAQKVKELGCPAEKVRVQHLGVEVDKIEYRPRVWHPGIPLRVLIVASFREKKGIPYAIEALARIQRFVDIEITIIGDASNEVRSQAEKQKILTLIARHGLNDKVRLLGYQPYTILFEEAYQHHIFLSPSVTASDGDTEGGAPVSLIDMAASGMPIVSSTHCDIPEIIQNGISGLLAPERDVDALADHLLWLTKYPDRWLPMVEAGRRHMEAEYDAQVQGQRLAGIYRTCASERTNE